MFGRMSRAGVTRNICDSGGSSGSERAPIEAAAAVATGSGAMIGVVPVLTEFTVIAGVVAACVPCSGGPVTPTTSSGALTARTGIGSISLIGTSPAIRSHTRLSASSLLRVDRVLLLSAERDRCRRRRLVEA